jgi:hypothetical protein
MSSILHNFLARFLQSTDENLTLSFCLDYAVEETIDDGHCHPGVECIADAEIEQMV